MSLFLLVADTFLTAGTGCATVETGILLGGFVGTVFRSWLLLLSVEGVFVSCVLFVCHVLVLSVGPVVAGTIMAPSRGRAGCNMWPVART